MVATGQCNILGNFTKVRQWNNVTRECYERGCVCKGCPNALVFSDGFKCQAKAAVLESVRVLGIPFEREIFKVVIDE